MSALPDHATFSRPSHDDWPIVLALWRGAMIERFSRAEVMVLTCLATMRDTGVPLPSDSFADGAPVRLRRLRETLEREDLGNRSRAAKRLLEDLSCVAENRAGIAHGSIWRSGAEIVIEWTCCRSGVEKKVRRLSALDLLSELTALDRTCRALSSELGQVRKAFRARTP